MKEQKYIRAYQIAVLTGSSLLIILLLAAWLLGGQNREWRTWQKEYRDLIDVMSDSVQELADVSIERGIIEFHIPDLGRTDRCVSCHMGMSNPQMEHADQPHRIHPGSFLDDHPVEDFGCTICHSGQGQALNKKDAFGRDQDTHWAEPMHSGKYLQSSCGKCHLTIYEDGEELAGTSVFTQGKEIFSREGCLGCHKARGLGGFVGPDLTEQGEKTKHDYSFQNISGEQTVSNWLKEHFKDPEMVSPGSQMLKIDLPEEQLEALATFVMGLAMPEIPFSYFSLETLNELKGDRNVLEGEDLYNKICAACHGKQVCRVSGAQIFCEWLLTSLFNLPCYGAEANVIWHPGNQG